MSGYSNNMITKSLVKIDESYCKFHSLRSKAREISVAKLGRFGNTYSKLSGFTPNHSATPFQMDQSPTANVRNAVVCDCEKENAHVYDGL